MSLSREEVEKIAHLARLAVRPEDLDAYARELSGILAFVEQMESVDTEGVTPMAHPVEASQRLRPDQPSEPDRRDRFQAIAPAVEGGLYLVPRVIE
ncbi:MAG: Asp-tRNA(Asn)/Glu-tRNA(Gln) amidotransferase subunit GatC [Ectothiorhodospira sp.]